VNGPAARSSLDQVDGHAGLRLALDPAWGFRLLEFALLDPTTSRWDNNGGRNYRIVLPAPPRPARTPAAAIGAVGAGERMERMLRGLDEGYELALGVRRLDGRAEIELATDVELPLYLHWGLARRTRFDWQLPDRRLWPAGTLAADERAVRTPFVEDNGLRRLHLDLAGVANVRGLCFVLFQEPARYFKDRGRDFFLAFDAGAARGPFAQPALNELCDEIIEREVGAGSWTLMHRFELAHQILERVPAGGQEGLALVFVWLRFSAIRQLAWQRNYNTKPRELAHAQDRLSGKLAERFAATPAERPLLRLLATTLGRGGEGQRVRDGILEIMHRHHIKEVAGHFLEEWHQKLHNNTTPDDVAICEAYLAFLEHGGDQGAFDRTLRAHGLGRERLRRYDRPIRSAPDFVPHLRDVLIDEFRAFLGILRALHAATDLGTAMQAARPFLDAETQGRLDRMWRHREDEQAFSPLAELVTAVREAVVPQLHAGRPGLRDLLYLDLALEDFLRATAERSLQLARSRDELLAWTELALRNLGLSRPNQELSLCLAHLRKLMAGPRDAREWSLHAQAVLERIRRELAALIDHEARLLQPIADHLGAGFAAEPWSVQLFSEEVVRGRLGFVLAALGRKLDAELRAVAGLGRWLVVSRGAGRVEGRLQVVPSLASVQGHNFEAPVLLVAEEVEGSEEIPENVTGVLTPSTVDLASHLAVRVRNAGILLATCYDAQAWQEVRRRDGQGVAARVSVAGEVEVVAARSPAGEAARGAHTRTLPAVPATSRYVIGVDDFCAGNVGSKSCNLRRLRGRLPEWIGLPPSLAIPFGVCERVLDEPANRAQAARLRELGAALPGAGQSEAPGLLAGLREVVTALAAPPELEPALREGVHAAGLTFSVTWAEAWLAIKRVWASKWNQRAWLSRRANGVADEALFMAVLIQKVVPAEYAFVIHTANPATGDRDELYAELVPGLGESLVGNHPGRALGFCLRRGERVPRLTSLPSKSLAIHGGELIFRSDSNGEDLSGYAGAGLHDSIVVPPERQERLDYTREELLWNEELRNRLLGAVANIGTTIEALFGAPQDIEGAYAQGRFTVLQARPQVGL
jgi:alpha-glucan,water dikinase